MNLLADVVIAPYKPLPWQIEPWRDKSPVLLLTGSAGGGKSRLAAEKVNAFMKKYHGATGLLLRKAREYATKSVVPFMRQAVGVDADPLVEYMKSEMVFIYSEWVDHSGQKHGGGHAYVGGMKDDNQRESIRSIGGDGSLDIVLMEEANAFSEEDFNEVLARMRGKAAPWTQIILVTNPDKPTHWIKRRLIDAGEASIYYSAAEQNSYNPPAYIGNLKKLTGVLGKRLRDGKWVQAEGAVYSDWDTEHHLKDYFDPPAEWRRILVIDFGYTNPFVAQWWAIDADGRMYLYREIYMSQRIVEDHADEIKRLIAGVSREDWEALDANGKQKAVEKGERLEAIISDHDAEDRATLERYGISTVAAVKEITTGIQRVQARLRIQEDGKPRLFMMRGALVEEDERLLNLKKPKSTLEEIDGYIWPKGADGKEVKEVPVKVDDHGMDAMRYAVMYVDQGLVGQLFF
jgi:PBSX family phage terminase large subunit